MENKPQETDSIHIQGKLSNTEEKAFWQQFKQTHGLTENSETLRAIVNQLRTSQSSPTLKTSLPEACYHCDLNGVLTTNKKGELIVRCILRLENKQPITKDRTISEAETCSQKPTYIKLPTKEKYEHDIQLLNGQLDREAENTDQLQREHDYYERIKIESMQEHADNKTLESRQEILEKELRKAKAELEPMEDLLTEKATLASKVSEMGNSLVERDHKIATLETDNAYKDELISKLSESELSKLNSEILKESDALHLELADKSQVISDYELDIEKVEALNEVQQRKTTEVISETRKMLRELRQYCPRLQITNLDPTNHPMQTYILTVQKKIEQFEGYLKTMTPKDNLEGFI
jgi:DNA repair exonuclease SbcCD ATPase subunit